MRPRNSPEPKWVCIISGCKGSIPRRLARKELALCERHYCEDRVKRKCETCQNSHWYRRDEDILRCYTCGSCSPDLKESTPEAGGSGDSDEGAWRSGTSLTRQGRKQTKEVKQVTHVMQTKPEKVKEVKSEEDAKEAAKVHVAAEVNVLYDIHRTKEPFANAIKRPPSLVTSDQHRSQDSSSVTQPPSPTPLPSPLSPLSSPLASPVPSPLPLVRISHSSPSSSPRSPPSPPSPQSTQSPQSTTPPPLPKAKLQYSLRDALSGWTPPPLVDYRVLANPNGSDYLVSSVITHAMIAQQFAVTAFLSFLMGRGMQSDCIKGWMTPTLTPILVFVNAERTICTDESSKTYTDVAQQLVIMSLVAFLQGRSLLSR